MGNQSVIVQKKQFPYLEKFLFRSLTYFKYSGAGFSVPSVHIFVVNNQ